MRDAIISAGLSIASEFVPFSKSRNAKEKFLSLNWKVTLLHKGRALFTCDYMAGVAHCPAYKLSVKEAGGHNSIMRHEMLKRECETGRVYFDGAPILPDETDVIACLLKDCDALQHAGFDSWCDELGFDSDSIKANAIYNECLQRALALRAAVGDSAFNTLLSAAYEH